MAQVIFSKVCDDSSRIMLLTGHPSLVKVLHCPETYIQFTQLIFLWCSLVKVCGFF